MGRTKQTLREKDGVKKKRKIPRLRRKVFVQRDVAPFEFVQTDLLDPACVRKLKIKQPQVIVTDCPWETDMVPKDHSKTTYELAPREKVKRLFRQIGEMFTPSKEYPVGHLYVWITGDNLLFGLKLLRYAGYAFHSINAWIKTTLGDNAPFKNAQTRSNVEMFLIGEKLYKGKTRMSTTRGVCGPPFILQHSSKPLEFYTEFLPWIARNQKYGRPWSQVEKVDLFTRHSQGGFLSVGNEFFGRRDSSVLQARPGMKRKKPRVQDETEERAPVKQAMEDVHGRQSETRGRTSQNLAKDDLVTVRDPSNGIKWDATIVQDRGNKYQVKWRYPMPGTSAFSWVDKDVVVSRVMSKD